MHELMALLGMSFASWALMSWLACAFLAAFVASEKYRCTTCWFVVGLLFGPVGLLAVVGLPDRGEERLRPSPKTHVTCPDCAEFVRNEAVVCCHCGCKLTPMVKNNAGLVDLQSSVTGRITQRDQSWIPPGYEDKA